MKPDKRKPETIKPCKECGSKDQQEVGSSRGYDFAWAWVRCDCGNYVQIQSDSMTEAVKAWNRRGGGADRAAGGKA